VGSLDKKIALVVGAGSLGDGISNGNACALSFARAGAAVVCADRFLERAEATAKLITDEGGRAVAVQADATVEADVQAAVDRTVSEYGRLDIIQNNVGVGGSWGLPDEIAFDDWNREIAQNLTSAYLGIRCAAPVMRAQGGGVILNVSSLFAVRFVRRPNTGYTAGKAAVEAMTRVCAMAYGRDNIRVNCLRIGFVETASLHHGLESRTADAEEKEKALNSTRRKVPLNGQHGEPFDTGGAAVFLASDAAKHITGAILNIDGGLEVAAI